MLAVTIDGLTSNATPSDVLVVLGNKVDADGKPSPRLLARLNAALRLYQQGAADYIIVSGGVGATGHDEAEVMGRYLTDAGVPTDRIIVDSAGVNTAATATNASQIMADQQWESAIVVSQFFHLSRTKLAFRQRGITQVSAASADFYETRDPYSLIREVIAYGKYLVVAA